MRRSVTMAFISCVYVALNAAVAEGQVRQLAGSWKLFSATNDQATLRVFSAGEGPTIVMLPGGGRGPSALEPLALRLIAAGFRIVLPEPRGYGESVGPIEGVTLRDLATDVIRAFAKAGGDFRKHVRVLRWIFSAGFRNSVAVPRCGVC